MYRFLLTPRWWAINLFVALAVPVCLAAGSWQLSRFEDQVDSHREQQERVADTGSRPQPLQALLPLTTDTVNQRASVTGSYDAERQLLVPERYLADERGYFVLTPLRPSGGGPAVPVVRGWLPGDAEPGRAPAPPRGEVTVVGALQAPESPSEVGAPTGLPPGQIGVIGAASLINVLPYGVADVWLTVTEAQPPMTPVPGAAPSGTGLDMDAFQNLGYTAEWFVFAGFAVFMWFRLFRREVETRRDAALGLPLPGVPPGAAGRPAGPGVTGPQAAAGAAARSGSPSPPA